MAKNSGTTRSSRGNGAQINANINGTEMSYNPATGEFEMTNMPSIELNGERAEYNPATGEFGSSSSQEQFIRPRMDQVSDEIEDNIARIRRYRLQVEDFNDRGDFNTAERYQRRIDQLTDDNSRLLREWNDLRRQLGE